MSKVRVHNLNISLDGYSAGGTVTLDEPIGHARSLFDRFDGRVIGGVHTIDDPITADRALYSMWGQGIGVEIMGRKKFGPQTGPWTDDEWIGWWGVEPPFETPVIVLTHHERDTLTFENGTSFHFVDATPAEALALARELAGDADVRLGGGPSSIRQFLDADLVDFMHLVTVPIVLGSGVSIFEGGEGVHERFDIESVTTGSGATHQFWNRRR